MWKIVVCLHRAAQQKGFWLTQITKRSPTNLLFFELISFFLKNSSNGEMKDGNCESGDRQIDIKQDSRQEPTGEGKVNGPVSL